MSHNFGEFQESNITIACQTAPSPGVVFTGHRPFSFDNNADNIIIRYCDIKVKDTLEASKNSSARIITIGGGKGVAPDNLIFDHLSGMWSTDDGFSIYVNSDKNTTVPSKITVSHSILGEGDTTCLRKDFECGSSSSNGGKQEPYRYPNHSMAAMIAVRNGKTMDGLTYVGNAMFNTVARSPQMDAVRGGEVYQNIISNAFGVAIRVSHRLNEVYIENNIIKDGPDSRVGNSFIVASGKSIAISGNTRHRQDGKTVTNYKGNSTRTIPFGPRQYLNGDNKLSLSCVGASKPYRDSSDKRLITEVNGTGNKKVSALAEVGIGPRLPPQSPCAPGALCFYEGTPYDQGQRDYSDYIGSKSHPANYDTDKDGIADAWERKVINEFASLKTLADINETTNVDGDHYTDLEEFLNTLARCPGISEGDWR